MIDESVFVNLRELGDNGMLDANEQKAYDTLKAVRAHFINYIKSHWRRYLDSVEATGDVVKMVEVLDFSPESVAMTSEFEPIDDRQVCKFIGQFYMKRPNSKWGFETLSKAFSYDEFNEFFIMFDKIFDEVKSQQKIVHALQGETIFWILTKLGKTLKGDDVFDPSSLSSVLFGD